MPARVERRVRHTTQERDRSSRSRTLLCCRQHQRQAWLQCTQSARDHVSNAASEPQIVDVRKQCRELVLIKTLRAGVPSLEYHSGPTAAQRTVKCVEQCLLKCRHTNAGELVYKAPLCVHEIFRVPHREVEAKTMPRELPLAKRCRLVAWLTNRACYSRCGWLAQAGDVMVGDGLCREFMQPERREVADNAVTRVRLQYLGGVQGIGRSAQAERPEAIRRDASADGVEWDRANDGAGLEGLQERCRGRQERGCLTVLACLRIRAHLLEYPSQQADQCRLDEATDGWELVRRGDQLR